MEFAREQQQEQATKKQERIECGGEDALSSSPSTVCSTLTDGEFDDNSDDSKERFASSLFPKNSVKTLVTSATLLIAEQSRLAVLKGKWNDLFEE